MKNLKYIVAALILIALGAYLVFGKIRIGLI